MLQVLEIRRGQPERHLVRWGEVSPQDTHHLAIGAHLLAADGGELRRIQPAAARRYLLPHGAVLKARGESEDG